MKTKAFIGAIQPTSSWGQKNRLFRSRLTAVRLTFVCFFLLSKRSVNPFSMSLTGQSVEAPPHEGTTVAPPHERTTVAPPHEQNVTSRHGQSIHLPCRTPNREPTSAVTWIKLAEGGYVLLFRDGGVDPNQTRAYAPGAYASRAYLEDGRMTRSDVSLRLNDSTAGDSGTYQCRVKYDTGSDLTTICIIYLRVSS